MGRQEPKLTEKHWKILELVHEGSMSHKEIAKEVGCAPQTIYNLMCDSSSSGQVASLFRAELAQMEKKQDVEIKKLMKTSKKLALKGIRRILADFDRKTNLSEEDKKMYATLTNCLSKAEPTNSTHINNLTYNYTKGLSPEELYYEFQRLQSAAQGPSKRGRVQAALEG